LKVLLINPEIRTWALPNVFPSGLGYIAAVLVKEGHEVEVLDLNANRMTDLELAEYLCTIPGPDLVGVTGIITQYNEVKKIANACKKMLGPRVPIVCGGPLATSISDLILINTDVDVVVLGEGEKAIFDIIEKIEAISEGIPLKCRSRDDLIQNLDIIPWPEYDLFPMDVYLDNPIGYYNTRKWKDGKVSSDEPCINTMNIVGSRGCPFSCIFCYHNYMGDGHRRRGVYDVVDEMYYLYWRYNASYIHFVDDAFCCNRSAMFNFCKAIGEVPIEWSCAGRPGIMDEILASKMHNAGCLGICYGLESGSQKILNRLNKGVTIKQYERAIELSKHFFSYEDYSFIIGSPGETDETINESIKFCEDNGIVPNAVFYMTPYPGTPLFDELLKTDPEFIDMVNTPELFEGWIATLGEQGLNIAWDCCGAGHEKLQEWRQKFIEETVIWNKK